MYIYVYIYIHIPALYGLYPRTIGVLPRLPLHGGAPRVEHPPLAKVLVCAKGKGCVTPPLTYTHIWV